MASNAVLAALSAAVGAGRGYQGWKKEDDARKLIETESVERQQKRQQEMMLHNLEMEAEQAWRQQQLERADRDRTAKYFADVMGGVQQNEFDLQKEKTRFEHEKTLRQMQIDAQKELAGLKAAASGNKPSATPTQRASGVQRIIGDKRQGEFDNAYNSGDQNWMNAKDAQFWDMSNPAAVDSAQTLFNLLSGGAQGGEQGGTGLENLSDEEFEKLKAKYQGK